MRFDKSGTCESDFDLQGQLYTQLSCKVLVITLHFHLPIGVHTRNTIPVERSQKAHTLLNMTPCS